MSDEVKSKITNPERIQRIVHRMCEGKMQVLIRIKKDSKVGIRATFSAVKAQSPKSQIHFNDISEFGLQKLSVDQSVRFEVIGMPSKVMFMGKITNISQGALAIELPTTLISIERRQNVRYPTTAVKMAYLATSLWKPLLNDVSAPPIFEQFRPISNWLPIFDMSIGGVCVKSHFPSALNLLTGAADDPKAKLILPMTDPIILPVAFRWQRRIKNRVLEAGRERYQLDFRLGIEFLEVEPTAITKIKQFLRQLSVADAI